MAILPNLSDDIRWSLDLRWQKCNQSVGFYGLKEGIQLGSCTDTEFKTNWDSYDGGATLNEVISLATKDGKEFNALNPGPWIQKWKVINTNKHVEALVEGIKKGGKDYIKYHPQPNKTRRAYKKAAMHAWELLY